MDNDIDTLIEEQKTLDEARRIMADEIIDPIPEEHLRRCAKAWVCTAAQETSNAAYWRTRAEAAEAALRANGDHAQGR